MKKKLCAAMLALLMVGSSAHSQNLVNETQEQKGMVLQGQVGYLYSLGRVCREGCIRKLVIL